ncbi:MAG: cytochrome c biogenesis protein CcdA [Clostridiales bacterium]|nr:cytochrome c biogenesis protein CcdA [Clostridiales bacterium]
MEYLISFLEGIITFVSPCLLPMLPLYLTYIAGRPDERTKNSTIISSFGFVTGFSITFILMGALSGTIGRFLIRYQHTINIVSGCIIIIFGLSYLGLFRIKLFQGVNRTFNTECKKGFFSSVLFGMIFSIGWTPCVGAFLGSALIMAAQTGSTTKGILMLTFYALGLGIPFILSSILINQLKNAFDFIKRNYKIINAIAGTLLILIGVLMICGIYQRFVSMIAFS